MIKKSFADWCRETKRISLLDEWSLKDNGISPEHVAAGSTEKYYWIGSCGHVWASTIASRRTGSGCPYCSTPPKAVLVGFNDLSTTHPKLASEWSEKNTLKPTEITKGNIQKVLWRCKNGHDYLASINSRTSGKGSGCPYCSTPAKKVLKGFNDLQSKFPTVAYEWHPTKNCDQSPDSILTQSNEKVWWICKHGHEWQASPATRVKGHGCPYCSGRFPTEENNLEVVDPKLAAEWHPNKNGELTPSMTSPFSMKKVWWLCNRGHEWKASVSNRHQGRGCAKCSSELKSSFPEQAIVYYLSKRLSIDSRKVINGWEVDIFLSDYSIAIEYDGIVYHSKDHLAEREHRKNLALQEAKIDLIRIKESYDRDEIIDNTIFFLVDYKYTHLDHAILQLFALLENRWGIEIRQDVNTNRDKLDILNEYISLEKNGSFAEKFSELVPFWNYLRNKNLAPENFRAMSNLKVWWKCPVCNGEWEESIINVAKGNRCPYCSNHKVLAGFNDLETKNPELASEWHPDNNGELTPRKVTPGSNKKVWWKCPQNHEWRATVARRGSNPECPYCKNSHKIIPPRDEQWKKNYEKAKEYFMQTGSLEIKAVYICEDGSKLGSWIRTQRICFNNHDLSNERITLLNQIGMVWKSKRGARAQKT